MAAIDIPADYWTIQPAGFTGLAQGFEQLLADVHRDVVGALNAHQATATGDVGQQLAVLDSDAAIIDDTIGNEHTAITSTPTAETLKRYGTGDKLTRTAQGSAIDYILNPPDPNFVRPKPLPDPNSDDPGVTHPPRVPDPTTPTPPRRPNDDSTPVVDASASPPPPTVITGTRTSAPVVAPGTPTPDVFGFAPVVGDATAAAAADVPMPAAAPAPDDRPVTHAQLAELLTALDFTINIQV